MKRIQSQKKGQVRQFLQRMFLQSSKHNESIKIGLLLAQYVLFTTMVSSRLISHQLVSSILSDFSTVIVLAALLMIKYIYKKALNQMLYLPCIFHLLESDMTAALLTINCLLLTMNIIIDIIAKIQFQFATQNPWSQTLNECKILHYCVVISSSILYIKQSSILTQKYKYISEGICLTLFTIVTICKSKSRPINFTLKSLVIRFYVLNIGYYARNIVVLWITSRKQLYQHLIVIITTQIFCCILLHKLKNINVDYQVSQSNIVNLIFTILSYSFDSTFQIALQKATKAFLLFNFNNHNNLIQNQSLLGKKQLKNNIIFCQKQFLGKKQGQYIEKRQFNLLDQRIKKGLKRSYLGQKAQQILSETFRNKEDDVFKCMFLIAQIKFKIQNNIIVSKKIIQKLKEQTRFFSVIKRICIYKFEQKIKMQIIKNEQQSRILYFKQFFQNQRLRCLIIKNTYQYLSLWKSIATTEIIFKRLSSSLKKILKKNSQLDRFYSNLKVRCNTTVLVYSDYLYRVRRDIQLAIQICRNFQVLKQFHNQLRIQNKVYASLHLSQDKLLFETVGFNIKKLLGYDKFQMKNSDISKFLPQFFSQFHQKLIKSYLCQGNENLFIINKNIMIKHFQEFYIPAQIQLKMVLNLSGQIYIQGFIQVKSDSSYAWTNYFIEQPNLFKIMQIGSALKQFISSQDDKFQNYKKFHENMDQQSSLGEKEEKINKNCVKKYFYYNGVSYQYDLISIFDTGKNKYSLYVCKTNIAQQQMSQFQKILEQSNKVGQQQFNLGGKFSKFETKFYDFQTNLSDFFSAKQVILKKIRSKKPVSIFIVVLIIFAICLAFQGIIVGRVALTRGQNSSIIKDMDNLVEFYHNLQNLGVMLKRAAFKVNKGLIFYYDYYDVVQVCLQLQTKNELLGKFNTNIDMQPGIQAIKNSKTLKQLINDLISNFFPIFYYKDPEIVLTCRHNVHVFFQYVWGDGLMNYLQIFINHVQNLQDKNTRENIIITVIIIALISVTYLLMFKIDNYQRNCEFQCINLVSSLNCASIFIRSINQFLLAVTGGLTEFYSRQGQKKQGSIRYRSQLFQTNSNISIKQHSIRGLFQQQPTSTNFHYKQGHQLPMNTIQKQQKVIDDLKYKRSIKTKPRSKLFLILWTGIYLVSVFIEVANIIPDNFINSLNMTTSIKRLMGLLEKQTRFSTLIVCYLDFVAFSQSQQLFIRNYRAYEKLQKLQVVFQETKYSQFLNFTQMYQNIKYAYLCQYMSCDPLYKDYLNIPYNLAIQKLKKFMIENVNVSLQNQGTIKQINLLFYAHYLIQNSFYQLINSYLKDYKVFQVKKYWILYLIYYFQILVFGVFIIFCVFLYLIFRNKRKSYIQILDLTKKQSYMEIEETPMQKTERKL